MNKLKPFHENFTRTSQEQNAESTEQISNPPSFTPVVQNTVVKRGKRKNQSAELAGKREDKDAKKKTKKQKLDNALAKHSTTFIPHEFFKLLKNLQQKLEKIVEFKDYYTGINEEVSAVFNAFEEFLKPYPLAVIQFPKIPSSLNEVLLLIYDLGNIYVDFLNHHQQKILFIVYQQLLYPFFSNDLGTIPYVFAKLLFCYPECDGIQEQKEFYIDCWRAYFEEVGQLYEINPLTFKQRLDNSERLIIREMKVSEASRKKILIAEFPFMVNLVLNFYRNPGSKLQLSLADLKNIFKITWVEEEYHCEYRDMLAAMSSMVLESSSSSSEDLSDEELGTRSDDDKKNSDQKLQTKIPVYMTSAHLDYEGEGKFEVKERLKKLPQKLKSLSHCIEPKIISQQASDESLMMLHSAEYVEFIKRSAKLAEIFPVKVFIDGENTHILKNYFQTKKWVPLLNETGLNPQKLMAAKQTVAAAIQATRDLMSGSTKAAMVISRPPGHHAGRDRTHGFCIFNNAAFCAYEVLTHGGNVLWVDFDVHTGDGSTDILKHLLIANPQWKDNIRFINLYAEKVWPNDDASEEKALFESEHFPPLINSRGKIILAEEKISAGAQWENIHVAFERQMGMDTAFVPTFILFSAGFDGHACEKITEGDGWKLQSRDFANIIIYFQRLYPQCSMLSVLEGGYHAQALAESIGMVCQVLARSYHLLNESPLHSTSIFFEKNKKANNPPAINQSGCNSIVGMEL